VPLRLNQGNLLAAVWVVGLKSQIKDKVLPSFRSMLKEIAGRIEIRFS
jgi:DNA-binding IclR family transcriptional regulator